MLYGLTGNICTGKSHVCDYLERLGLEVIRADTYALQAYADPSCMGELEALLGGSIINNHGIDRRAIKFALISAPEKTHAVWDIITTYSEPLLLQEISKDRSQPTVLEAAQLFERGYDRFCTKTIVVTMPLEKQISLLRERARIRDGFELSESDARIAIGKQMSQEEKVQRARYHIENAGDLPDLDKSVQKLYELILHGAF